MTEIVNNMEYFAYHQSISDSLLSFIVYCSIKFKPIIQVAKWNQLLRLLLRMISSFFEQDEIGERDTPTNQKKKKKKNLYPTTFTATK